MQKIAGSLGFGFWWSLVGRRRCRSLRDRRAMKQGELLSVSDDVGSAIPKTPLAASPDD